MERAVLLPTLLIWGAKAVAVVASRKEKAAVNFMVAFDFFYGARPGGGMIDDRCV
jgi:hypothetical protein